jgi:hypothetical protein
MLVKKLENRSTNPTFQIVCDKREIKPLCLKKVLFNAVPEPVIGC